MPAPIGRREEEILTAIVESYISTGEPVGSRTLARTNREGLSAATIRNVMADLADAGLLEQPHTSAGRVPSLQGYRYYVEKLSGIAKISQADERTINQCFQGTNDIQDFMERTSHILSLMSGGVGVAIAGGGAKSALEHVHFQKLADHRVLAVVVSKGGFVRDRVLRLERDLPQSDLDLAGRYVNENFRGWTMDSIRQELARRVEQERSEYNRLMQSIGDLCGALATERSSQGVYVEGASNLVLGEQDSQRLQEMLKTLEEKQRIVELLSAYLDARQETVRVVIGLQDAMPNMGNFVLIGAPARVGDEMMGSLAVIGPSRMDYQHTISAVSYIASLFNKVLNDSEL